MRRFSFPLALVVILASALAFAAPKDQQKAGQFSPSLGLSTITGDARLNPMKADDTRVQGHLDGLTPGIEYEARISADDVCGSGVVIATFTANAAGKANFNELVAQPISTIESVSVNRLGDPTVLSCADVQ